MSRQLWRSIGLVGMMMVTGCTGNSKLPSVSSSEVAPKNSPSLIPAPKNVWMTEFKQINGTSYLHAPIYVAEQEQKSVLRQIKSAGSEYSGRESDYTPDIRNYMFVHRDNLSARKLLSNNSSRLLELEQIGEPAPPDQSNTDPSRTNNWIKTVKTLWYVQVLADTNGDKKLDDLDRKQIAISDISGENYTEVIKNIDKILLVYPKGLDRRLVFYTSGKKHFVADVDLPNRQATIKELPALN
jgi:hypothetical protein